MAYKCKNCGETFPYVPVYCNECGISFTTETFELVNPQKKQIIILDAPCSCAIASAPYRWALDVNETDPYKSAVFVQRNNGECWDPTPGRWYLGTLMNIDGFCGNSMVYDYIYIDGGLQWGVSGLAGALAEIEQKLNLTK